MRSDFSGHERRLEPSLASCDAAFLVDKYSGVWSAAEELPNCIVHAIHEEAGFDLLLVAVFMGASKAGFEGFWFIDEDFIDDVSVGEPFEFSSFTLWGGTADGVGFGGVEDDDFDLVAEVGLEAIDMRAVVARDRAGEGAVDEENGFLFPKRT